ncbi:metallophosphoesterase family protein [Microbacterium telephonicum]|uniref:Calcineurin-like phosphoesterase family protein n=1 Tax=Microbacterium telephonicum TaxID=1714841 RepID=A0A498C2R1_9MICO|nr:metallophosphoesterase [Microbacterium telephonicum]RLK49327.1 calcineurin-like phosphoesterase family protein [Microbacterium telephonicum]
MRILESVGKVELPDSRVAVCGDWHGNIVALRRLAPAIATLAPEVKSVLQLGDWSMNTAQSDSILAAAGIERVYVTLGNHEPWGSISPLLDTRPGEAIRVSELTWLLPRPARLLIGGREVLSLGGAASVDRPWRREGKDWWSDEAITDAHVEAAIAGGPADVMLTHETPNGTPVRSVRRVLRGNPFGFPASALIASAESRARVDAVWDATHPKLLLHGHMHVAGPGVTDDGRRVISLGRDGEAGHLAFLNMSGLEVEMPSIHDIRNVSTRSWEI